jgi:peroxiredoxin Q/BCP
LNLFFNKAKAEEEEEEEEEGDAAALPKIELGGSLPSVTLKNEKGEDIQVADLAAEKGVILFLVPKADTRTSFLRSGVPMF